MYAKAKPGRRSLIRSRTRNSVAHTDEHKLLGSPDDSSMDSCECQVPWKPLELEC